MFYKNDDQELSQLKALLAKAGSSNKAEAQQAQAEFAKAIETPLRKVLLSGNIVNGIFEPMDFTSNPRVEFPLDLIVPGDERNYYAYVIPDQGRIPERRVESDYLMVPTYRIGNSIDCTLRFIRDSNWPVISRMLEILEAGFVKKMNDDGWQVLLAAALDRNVIVNDPNATAGQLTPRLIQLLKTFMRRNGGGNSNTLNRAKLTDMYVSPEAIDDIRAWDLSLVPDAVRTNIYYSDDNGGELLRVLGVNLHSLDELGEGQEYQTYYTGTLGGTMTGSDVEIAVGLDLSKKDSFVNPIREAMQLYEDNTMHRKGIFSLYGYTEMGWAVLDSRRTLLASL